MFLFNGSYYCEDHAPIDSQDCSDSEVDCPQHCAECDYPLDYSLTSDGVQYVLEAIRESLKVGRKARNTIHDVYQGGWYAGSRHCEIVREWAEKLKWYGGLSNREESLIDHYLSWTSK